MPFTFFGAEGKPRTTSLPTQSRKKRISSFFAWGARVCTVFVTFLPFERGCTCVRVAPCLSILAPPIHETKVVRKSAQLARGRTYCNNILLTEAFLCVPTRRVNKYGSFEIENSSQIILFILLPLNYCGSRCILHYIPGGTRFIPCTV